MPGSDKTAENRPILVDRGPPPELGEEILERRIPSNAALVMPTVVRITEFLVDRYMIPEKRKNQIGLCLEEALRNAVVHGNKEDFSKVVDVRLFESVSEWVVKVTDSGEGFDPAQVPDPSDDEGVWGESGRGLRILSMYSDRMSYYQNGTVLVLWFNR